jgi:hypothetical protein
VAGDFKIAEDGFQQHEWVFKAGNPAIGCGARLLPEVPAGHS